LPAVIAKAQQSIELVDEMLKHPGRETATGLSGSIDPRNYIPGTDAKDFQIRQKQLQGRVFLEAFETLKGGGAITEAEGAAATRALGRLDLAQSDKEYAAALKELRGRRRLATSAQHKRPLLAGLHRPVAAGRLSGSSNAHV
jgi:hypothetical protein